MIHVAGTNGKGSTIAFMRAILEAAGLRVHVYTSPHLVRFHERIRLGRLGGGRFVDEERLVEALRALRGGQCRRADHLLRDHDGGGLPALRRRSRRRRCCSRSGSADGSTRPTSSTTPAAAVVTPVGLDHSEYLGDTLSTIAREKAGIFKRGLSGRDRAAGYAEPTPFCASAPNASARIRS